MPDYRIGRLKGRFTVEWHDSNGKRHRYRLDATDARGAAIEAPGIYATLNRPKGSTVADIWNAYLADHAGRAVAANMPHNWKALAERFGALQAEGVTIEDCRAHSEARSRAGIKPGTIATELGRLRMVLRWAEKRRLIARAPTIERPSPPKRRDLHLTRDECRALIGHAGMPHLRLYIILALATAARNRAILDLTWDRCDFARGKIDLRNPAIGRPHKGRAIVPMNRSARAALLDAHAGALTDYVVEWAGDRVQSVRRGLKAAARRAGIAGPVSPHLLRHSAAVHMAEAGIPMEEIAQYLGHEDVGVTRKVYARFSPAHLQRAAAVLDYDGSGSSNHPSTTFSGQIPPEIPEIVVGATGIEPVTPTMSRKRSA